MPIPADPNRSVAQWNPAVDGPLPVTGGAGSGQVKIIDGGGVNTLAVTAAGDAKVTLDGEINTVRGDPTGIKFARINCTASGLTTIVAAVASKKIRVYGYVFTSAAAGTVTIQDDSGSPVVLAGAFDLSATCGISFAGSRECPAFETTAGQALQFNLSAVMLVRGHLCYEEI